jgi:hypothetical protein
MLALGRALCSLASHAIPLSAPRSAAPQVFESQAAASLCSLGRVRLPQRSLIRDG